MTFRAFTFPKTTLCRGQEFHGDAASLGIMVRKQWQATYNNTDPTAMTYTFHRVPCMLTECPGGR